MALIDLKNQDCKSRSRVVSDLATEEKACCTDCGFITGNDPKLAFYRPLNEAWAKKRSEQKGVRVVADFYCGCSGWN